MAQTIRGIFTADKLHREKQYFNPCQLRPFHPHGCPKPLTPHHCVPDHCWKPRGGSARINLGNTTPATEMSRKDGLCICVDGSGKSSDSSAGVKYRQLCDTYKDKLDNLQNAGDSKALAATFKREANDLTRGTTTIFANMGSHSKIHHIFDAAEDELAKLNKNATPSLGENVATLSQLENLAATVLAKVTGCDAKDLKRQMRSYHHSKGFSGKTLLRARAEGGAPAAPNPPNALGQPTDLSKAQRTTARQGVSTFLNDSYTRLGI